MKQRIAFALIIIAFAMSGALHYREYRKSQEISDILRIQAEIEFKRTSLMVVYQEVLQSVGVEPQLVKIPGLRHRVTPQVLEYLAEFLE